MAAQYRALTQANASFFEFGWSPGTDPWVLFNSILRTYDGAGSGTSNAGRYSNQKLDELIDAMRVEHLVDVMTAQVNPIDGLGEFPSKSDPHN